MRSGIYVYFHNYAHHDECPTGCHYAECHNSVCHCTDCHYAECDYAECHYADCHYADWHYADWHYAKCHYADCHGAVKSFRVVTLFWGGGKGWFEHIAPSNSIGCILKTSQEIFFLTFWK